MRNWNLSSPTASAATIGSQTTYEELKQQIMAGIEKAIERSQTTYEELKLSSEKESSFSDDCSQTTYEELKQDIPS